jgi:hypothetical protein
VRKSKHKPKPPRPKPARAQNLAEPPPACAVRSSLENALANLTPDQRKRMCGDGEPLKRMAPVLAEGAGYHITEEDRRIIDRAATEERRLLRKIQAAMSAPLSNPAPEAKRPPQPPPQPDKPKSGRRSPYDWAAIQKKADKLGNIPKRSAVLLAWALKKFKGVAPSEPRFAGTCRRRGGHNYYGHDAFLEGKSGHNYFVLFVRRQAGLFRLTFIRSRPIARRVVKPPAVETSDAKAETRVLAQNTGGVKAETLTSAEDGAVAVPRLHYRGVLQGEQLFSSHVLEDEKPGARPCRNEGRPARFDTAI